MEWIELKKREIGRLNTTFHFAEAVEGLLRDLLLQHELNHHLYITAQAPLPAILRIIAFLEESLDPGQALETLWVLSSLEDPDGLLLSFKNRLFGRVEQSLRKIDDTEVLYRWGYICFQNGQFSKLADLFLQGRLDEHDFRVILLKARLAIATRQNDLGLQILENIVDQFSEAAHHQAGLYWRAGVIPQARQYFLRLLNEKYMPAMKDAVRFFLATQEPGRALEAALLLPGLKRGEPESKILLGGSYLQVGETQLGVKELLEAQNEIWVRAFPVKYDSDFRISQEFLRKGLYQLGMEAGKHDLLSEMVAHPQFDTQKHPAYVREPIHQWGEKAHLADIHFLCEWMRNPERTATLTQYQQALHRLGDPRHTLLQAAEYGDPFPIPEEWDRRDEIIQRWFGGEPTQALFQLGLPQSLSLSEKDQVDSASFFPWRLAVQELSLTQTNVDSHWAMEMGAKQMPQLQKLTFNNLNLDMAFAQVWASNPGIKKITELEFHGGKANFYALQYLLSAAEGLPTRLVFDGLTIDYPLQGEWGLGGFLAQHPRMVNIKHLEIRHTALRPQDLATMAKSPFANLTHLLISHQQEPQIELEWIAKAEWWPKLQQLDCSFTGWETALVRFALESGLRLDWLGCQSEEDSEEWNTLKEHPNWHNFAQVLD